MTMSKSISDRLLGYKNVTAMMGTFGIVALILSAVGVFGVKAYSVSERVHEIGLRMALGVGRCDALWMVRRWGLLLAGSGLVIACLPRLRHRNCSRICVRRERFRCTDACGGNRSSVRRAICRCGEPSLLIRW